MSRDVFVIHSSEVDDTALLAEGFYVASAYPDETVTAEMCKGPHATHDAALDAMRESMFDLS
jgi:Mn-dependent DtxR family transcriptional regulator